MFACVWLETARDLGHTAEALPRIAYYRVLTTHLIDMTTFNHTDPGNSDTDQHSPHTHVELAHLVHIFVVSLL